MDQDTSWCPVCDRQILPKRFLVPVPPPPPPAPAPPPSSPTRKSKGTTRGGLVQGTGRVKPNGSLKRSDSKPHTPPAPAVPIKLRTVIDQGPTPLYCSDECQLADINQLHGGLPMDYSPDRQPISPSLVSLSRSDSDSTHSSGDSQSSLPSYSSAAPNPSHMSPSLATLATIYHFPPLPPPPPPIDHPTVSFDSECQPPEYTSGVMMAARRIAGYCPKPQKRDVHGHIIPPAEPRKVIPDWTDGSHRWRNAVYNMSPPECQSNHDIKPHHSFAAASHRSTGVHSTFNATSSSRSASDVRAVASMPAESNDMIHRFSQSFNRRSESRVSLYASSPKSQSPITSSSPPRRERSLLQPGAEGKLLVPDVKMKVHSGSSASLSSAWTGSSSRRSSVRSPLSVTSSSSDEDGLTQRCESAASLPHMLKRPGVEARSWSYDNFKTYPTMRPIPKKEKRVQKQLVDGVEMEVEVEVEVDQPIKRLFLFPPSSRV